MRLVGFPILLLTLSRAVVNSFAFTAFLEIGPVSTTAFALCCIDGLGATRAFFVVAFLLADDTDIFNSDDSYEASVRVSLWLYVLG